jgi:hypothetical protein
MLQRAPRARVESAAQQHLQELRRKAGALSTMKMYGTTSPMNRSRQCIVAFPISFMFDDWHGHAAWPVDCLSNITCCHLSTSAGRMADLRLLQMMASLTVCRRSLIWYANRCSFNDERYALGDAIATTMPSFHQTDLACNSAWAAGL